MYIIGVQVKPVMCDVAVQCDLIRTSMSDIGIQCHMTIDHSDTETSVNSDKCDSISDECASISDDIDYSPESEEESTIDQ